MNNLKTFYEEYKDIFEDYLQNARKNLKKSSDKYIKLKREYHEILEKNENLNWILEGKADGRTLTNEECLSLSKLAKVYFEIQTMEEKELFFLGARENYSYLKNIRVL